MIKNFLTGKAVSALPGYRRAVGGTDNAGAVLVDDGPAMAFSELLPSDDQVALLPADGTAIAEMDHVPGLPSDLGGCRSEFVRCTAVFSCRYDGDVVVGKGGELLLRPVFLERPDSNRPLSLIPWQIESAGIQGANSDDRFVIRCGGARCVVEGDDTLSCNDVLEPVLHEWASRTASAIHSAVPRFGDDDAVILVHSPEGVAALRRAVLLHGDEETEVLFDSTSARTSPHVMNTLYERASAARAFSNAQMRARQPLREIVVERYNPGQPMPSDFLQHNAVLVAFKALVVDM